MKHHCSARNLSAQLAKLTGNVYVTGKPRRLKQMLRDMGRREHLATSTSLGHSQTAGGASVTWRKKRQEEKTWCLLRHKETILDRKNKEEPPSKPALQLSTAWLPKPLMSPLHNHRCGSKVKKCIIQA